MVDSSEQRNNSKVPKQLREHAWKPGESGNPGGRPKDKGLTPVQIEMMDKECPYAKKPGTTWRQWLAEKGLLQIADKPQAVKDYKDRVEGVVKDELEVTEVQKIEYIPAKEKDA